MSSPTPSTLATSPNTGMDPDDVVGLGVAPHGAGGPLAHRAASEEVGKPKDELEELRREVICLRETLGKTKNVLDETQARLLTLELGQTRIEAQLDLLIRIKQPMAMPHVAAQAPPSSRGTDPDSARVSQRRTLGVCATCAGG